MLRDANPVVGLVLAFIAFAFAKEGTTNFDICGDKAPAVINAIGQYVAAEEITVEPESYTDPLWLPIDSAKRPME